MPNRKTVNLLLKTGSLSGLLIAELSSWHSGILLSAPRESVSLLADEKESGFWGIYLLLSDTQIYIGQSNELLPRIRDHLKNKDWWNQVILLTTTDNSLEKSELDYLEYKMIELTKRSGKYNIANIQNGNQPKVSRYKEVSIEKYLEETLLLLELLGVRNFIGNGIVLKKHRNTEKPPIKKVKRHKLTKKEAIHIINKDNDIDITDKKVTFATINMEKDYFWINPSTDFVNYEWIIILHEPNRSQLTVLEIPAMSLSTGSRKGNLLFVRNDRPHVIELKLRRTNLVDIASGVNFSPYILKVIKYEK